MKVASSVMDLFDVTGHGVIVTGGASGLGLAFVEALAEQGARVTVLDLDRTGMQLQLDRMCALGWDVRGTVVDITDREAVDRAFDEAVAEYGRLDTVFANAGIDPGAGVIGADGQRSAEGALENYGDDRWDRVIDTNLNSVFTTIRAATRHMRPNGGGRIVVTTSAASNCSTGVALAYSAAKAGAGHLMRNAALQLARYNILLNAIAPGPFVTNIGDGLVRRPEVQAFMNGIIPLHRVGQLEDIKGLALFLGSAASRYITGAEIPIDGGLALGTPID